MSAAGTRDAEGSEPHHEVVDQVASVLADPNVHTDQRMRLAQQIEQLLLATGSGGDHPGAPASGKPGQPGSEDEQLVAWLDAVLVDPDVHTDMRLRLHRDILKLLEAPWPGRSEHDSETGGQQGGNSASN
jgi:hypothetical protein